MTSLSPLPPDRKVRDIETEVGVQIEYIDEPPKWCETAEPTRSEFSGARHRVTTVYLTEGDRKL